MAIKATDRDINIYQPIILLVLSREWGNGIIMNNSHGSFPSIPYVKRTSKSLHPFSASGLQAVLHNALSRLHHCAVLAGFADLGVKDLGGWWTAHMSSELG